LMMLEILEMLHKCNSTEEIRPRYQLKTKRKRSDVFHRLCRWDMARQIKESYATVAPMGYDRTNIDPAHRNMPKVPIELPDGTILEMGVERYHVAELLFGRDDLTSKKREDAASKTTKSMLDNSSPPPNPSKPPRKAPSAFLHSLPADNISSAPIPSLVCDAAFKCDRDQQAQLLGNVMLSGGGTCLENMQERLRDEVEAIIHTHTPGWRVKVLAPAPPERSVCAWLGGSILGSLGSFHDMWISKAEYDECGAGIVNKKCP